MADPELEQEKNGIIDSALNYKAKEINPVTTEVRPEVDTVEGRIDKLTSKDNAYNTNRRQSAVRQSAKRGLVNSSIAAGAGEKAVIEGALPIATADAKAYNEERLSNQDAQNKFRENVQSTELNKEIAGFQSGLSTEEARKQSEFNVGEATAKSALTNQENTILNDLATKRDINASSLTQEENAQLNDLEMKRDAASSGLSAEEARIQSQLDMTRDTNSTELNASLERLRSTLGQEDEAFSVDLKTRAELILADEKFADDTKIQYITAIDSLLRDTNAQVTEISLSDRSAAQQASAMERAYENRDAQIAVYEDLLGQMTDWTWDADFTPNIGSNGNSATNESGSAAAPTGNEFDASQWEDWDRGSIMQVNKETGERIHLNEYRRRLAEYNASLV